MEVLAIGSHFDDVEIGCGGILFHHQARGDPITIAVLNSDDPLVGDVTTRSKEQNKSCSMLSANLIKFNSTDQISHIVNLLDNLKPTTLYFPHQEDYHQDHVKAYQVGKAVGRDKRKTMLAYLTPTSFNYYPNALKEINLIKKIDLINCFVSQVERRPDYLETMKAQHKFFGSLIGVDAAEGFIFHRMIL